MSPHACRAIWSCQSLLNAVARAVAHLSRGVFPWDGRLVGLLDDARLFEALRAKLR